MREKVLVGMSGGVDSTVAAHMLQRQGYEVVGITLNLNGADFDTGPAEACAEALGIEFHTAECSDVFSETVKKYFAESYIRGETPNPCVLCNKLIKFGYMMNFLETYDCTHIATGHYANVEYDPCSGRYLLKKGADTAKDQSYFLWRLNQSQLSKTLFPLGNMVKSDIRRIAAEAKLPCAQSRDSQDICFVSGGNYRRFIEDFTGIKFPPGNFIDPSGTVMGRHRGIIGYTLGQRRGLGVSAGKPVYVTGKNIAENTVTLGGEELLYRREVTLKDVNLSGTDTLTLGDRYSVKLRYSVREYAAEVLPLAEGRLKLIFDEPQRAPTPGQSGVLYKGETVVAGGIIE
jgi:tRNA-specific 2-thiouridylase